MQEKYSISIRINIRINRFFIHNNAENVFPGAHQRAYDKYIRLPGAGEGRLWRTRIGPGKKAPEEICFNI